MSINNTSTSKTQAQITLAITILGIPQSGDETWVKRAQDLGLGARVARKAKAKGFWVGRAQARTFYLAVLMLGKLAAREATSLEQEIEDLREENILLREVDLELLGCLIPTGIMVGLMTSLGVMMANPEMVQLGETPGNRALIQAEELYKKAEARASSPQGQFCKFLRGLHGNGVKCNF